MKNFPAQIISLIRIIVKNDLVLPLTLLFTYIVFLVIARGVVPTSEELIILFGDLYTRFGYEIIFVSALLEGLVFVNLFVPGMLALALGAVFARTGQTDLTLVIITASFGTVLGYLIDFLMGYFGFGDTLEKLGYKNFLQSSKDKLKKFGNRGLIVGFFHSNFGSFLALAAGTIRYSFINFVIVAIAATLVWTTVWGFAAFYFGDIFLTIIKRYSFLLVLAVIAFFILASYWKYKSESKSKVKS
jgi:membrane-associated protein